MSEEAKDLIASFRRVEHVLLKQEQGCLLQQSCAQKNIMPTPVRQKLVQKPAQDERSQTLPHFGLQRKLFANLGASSTLVDPNLSKLVSKWQRPGVVRSPIFGRVDFRKNTIATPKRHADCEYRLWKESVFNQVGNICALKMRRVLDLFSPSHQSWTEFPELRYELSNGQWLVQRSHQRDRQLRRPSPRSN